MIDENPEENPLGTSSNGLHLELLQKNEYSKAVNITAIGKESSIIFLSSKITYTSAFLRIKPKKNHSVHYSVERKKSVNLIPQRLQEWFRYY